MLPSAFVNYFTVLDQTGVKTKKIPPFLFDSTYKFSKKKQIIGLDLTN